MYILIITIGREFGSNGTKIGKIISEKLEIPFYDKEIIAISAKESGYDEELFNNVDEKHTTSFLFSVAMGIFSYSSKAENMENSSFSDKLFSIQKKVIGDIAENGDCVIIGRCSDFILKDNNDVTSVFICSDFNNRIKTISERNGLSENKAKDLIIKTDKKRASYYNYYTGKKWGSRESYDFIINSDSLGLDKTADFIISLAKSKQKI